MRPPMSDPADTPEGRASARSAIPIFVPQCLCGEWIGPGRFYLAQTTAVTAGAPEFRLHRLVALPSLFDCYDVSAVAICSHVGVAAICIPSALIKALTARPPANQRSTERVRAVFTARNKTPTARGTRCGPNK